MVSFDVGLVINFVMRWAFEGGNRGVALVPRRSSGYLGVGFTGLDCASGIVLFVEESDVGVAWATEAIGTAAGGIGLHVGFERAGFMSICGSA